MSGRIEDAAWGGDLAASDDTILQQIQSETDGQERTPGQLESRALPLDGYKASPYHKPRSPRTCRHPPVACGNGAH